LEKNIISAFSTLGEYSYVKKKQEPKNKQNNQTKPPQPYEFKQGSHIICD